MAEMPIELRKLQPVRGALDILRYLSNLPDMAADSEDIVDDLGLSDRSFGKATRRLVTNGYIAMRSDYVYELTQKGEETANTLKEVEGDASAAANDGSVQRDVVIALPRNLVAGQTAPMKIGFAPLAGFKSSDVVLRLQSIYANVGDFDEMQNLADGSLIIETTIAPQTYDQARLKLEVFQMSAGGDDLNAAGGMYVDVVVLPEGDMGEMIAYSVPLEFKT